MNVVVGGVPEGRGGERAALLQREAALAHGIERGVVACGIDHHRHRCVVLGRGANHRWAADVDLLDDVVLRGARCHGRGERVQVDHHKVERLDAQLLELGAV